MFPQIIRGSRTIRTLRCAAGALIITAGLVAAASPAANAKIAQPPGANPSNRGYELVSLPDAANTEMYVGTSVVDQIDGPRAQRPSFRLPAVARAGGAAVVGSRFPIPGQPARGANSTYRSVRQASGAWSQTPLDPDLSHSLGLPDAWTPDFSKVVFLTDPPGTDKALSTDGRTITFDRNDAADPANDPAQNNVYQQTDGGPEQRVNVTTGGSSIDNARLQSVTGDGARSVFAADDGTGSGSRLYVRDGSTTFAIDAARQTLAARTDSRFWKASDDGRTVFFSTRDRLLAADVNDDADIYRWTEDGDDLQLVTPGTGTSCPQPLPIPSGVQNCDAVFAGASADGSLVYFYSPEQLGGPSAAAAGAPNVYVRDRQGPIRYAMSGDQPVYLSLDPTNPTLAPRSGGVERDGSFLAVTYVNPTTGAPFDQSEIVRFDPRTDTTVCVSCASVGGFTSLGRISQGGETPANNTTADGSHVFFNTTAALVTADHNSATDVYDYDVATGERTLVSAGATAANSNFAGVSDDGTDVMIATTDTLVARDRNGEFQKVYDARRGGGEQAPGASATPCGTACTPAPPTPPPFSLDGSVLGGQSEGNVTQTPAVRLAVGAVSSAQRRAFARGGTLPLAVRTSAAATVRAKATARVGRATATVASGSVRLRRAGKARVALRLSRAARTQLRKKKSLKVTLAVSVAGGSASKKLSLSLRAPTNAKAGAR